MIGIFLDIESNGLDNTKHRILEIAFKFIDLTSREVLSSYDRLILQPKEVWAKSDPNSLEVNGFTYEKTLNGISESTASTEIQALFKEFNIQRKKAVYICQNPSFDRSFFAQLIDPQIQENNLWPYHWLDLASMFWAIQLKSHQLYGEKAPWEIGISKDNIAKTLGLETEKSPHRAMQGVDHLIECYFSLNTCHQP